MKRINDRLYLRPVRDEDSQIWRQIFDDSVSSHFGPAELAPDALRSLLDMQFLAQETDYRANYPNAANDLIVFDDEIVGRVVISTEHGDIHLIDLAVLSQFRNCRIGTMVLEWLMQSSRESQLPIRFYVEKLNPAYGLYSRLGFQVVADVTSHFQMEWRPETDSEKQASTRS